MLAEFATIVPTPSRAAKAPQGAPAQKPSMLPHAKAACMSAGGRVMMVLEPSETPRAANQSRSSRSWLE
jgi:hypothetical protein